MKYINKEKILLLTVIIIQIMIYVFLGTQKSYIHMDEAYSIGLTNYNKVDITENADFYNNWHTKEYYQDYISISKEELTNIKPVYENQKNDVHPPFYYLLLRIAYSLHTDNFSKWPGLILNIIIMVLSNILVYKISRQVINNKKISLLICLVNGLVVSSLESVMYIRMYALNAYMLLLVAYIHLNNLKNEDINIKTLIVIGTTVLISALTHYYNLIYIAVIYIIYILLYVKNKQYKNILKYTSSMAIAGILFLIIFPYSIKHIFMGYRGQGVLYNFTNMNQMIINLKEYINIVNLNVFNKLLGLIALFFIVVVCYKLIKNKQIVLKIRNTKMMLIIIPAIIYFIVVSVSSPYIEIRYIIPICSFVFIYVIYVINLVINKLLKEKQSEIVLTIILIIILIMPLIAHIEVSNLYLENKEIVKQVEEKYSMLPTIYLFYTGENRFLDDIYLFTKIEESYILNIENINEQKIQEILENKDVNNGILLWVNEGFEKDDYIKIIMEEGNFNNCKHLKRMNACDIYYIFK